MIVNQRNVVKIHFVTAATLSGFCIGGSSHQYGFRLSHVSKIHKWDGQSLPVSTLSCNLFIAGFCHLICIVLVFRILIVGSVGDNSRYGSIGIIAIGFCLLKLHPNHNAVGTSIQYGIERISIFVSLRYAHVQRGMIALIFSTHRICIQTACGDGSIIDKSKNFARFHQSRTFAIRTWAYHIRLRDFTFSPTSKCACSCIKSVPCYRFSCTLESFKTGVRQLIASVAEHHFDNLLQR